MGRPIHLKTMIDSNAVLIVVANGDKTTERSLQIDISDLRERYEKGELSRLVWGPKTINASDYFKNSALSSRLSSR